MCWLLIVDDWLCVVVGGDGHDGVVAVVVGCDWRVCAGAGIVTHERCCCC